MGHLTPTAGLSKSRGVGIVHQPVHACDDVENDADATPGLILVQNLAPGEYTVTESQVPAFFYVESPVNVVPSRGREDSPRTGVTFNGTKRTVLINDVISAMGRRDPAPGQASRVHRQAFIFVLSNGHTLDRAQTDKIDAIRRAWETFFSHAVDGRARIESRLRPSS